MIVWPVTVSNSFADFETHAPAPTTITSDGTRSKPYCSYMTTCTLCPAEQAECMQKLCESSGFAVGEFVSAANDPCTSSATTLTSWQWLMDEDRFHRGALGTEGKVTASCY